MITPPNDPKGINQESKDRMPLQFGIKTWLHHNWPLVASGFSGVVVGIFIIGQLVNGIRVSTKDGFEISVDRTKLPTELDIEGDWFYVAEINNDTRFTEDGCRKRIGTVSIKQKEGTPEVILNGRRLLRAECGYANTQIAGTAIPWKSDDAVVKLKEKELFLWLMTADDEPRYAHVSANIKSIKNRQPSQMEGQMFYLEDGTNTWFKSKIDFFRVGSAGADRLKGKYPDI
jgi:hypothetical protein